ncbi:hypothetical protein A3K29_02075 [Candidatus Collierbacteria bacterium RIFOXYB2_FULL_46_14]|uniref:Cytidyltransferase-like domain-containing protein n=1 Tax=Candidatus Collierbacteria bacterium GW2011_GWA2_46_26 TaxID=1618381 RepID=A0A0G1PJR1_9BACT|nr:MAG: hypothetical protein UW29_C0013G0025 [Candidatus Collierbacteria bacterium GW2011_GWC2_44_13]KKU32937.1 MAG: hypothetical protein UX47_C0007G0181 [Candidatus Collierbacteria bacterium GW2011_GWA2_46_26]OGD72914.1 MAG: hypothetical protein A3K29_02075 [Candidatus Collierbacteria bacterium RIFOXYB2_FULL_46_14]OGD75956.1 MAG: hypothetical protein A3K43_02075 [Candidatus Collierbacteria bacterium RIFOXYA2_FULL_46_20]OGD77292.1 MAG: hypothetical protein A3K39_02075 [Candidatus Collierbacteri
MKEVAVLLGRFSPFHKGHQAQVDLMITERGLENCMIIIGSSNSCNQRTPFSYEQRREIIKQIYPAMRIVPLPDINPKLVYFDGSTNDQWLAEIKKLENNMAVRFVFYGGSNEDLAVLATKFMTKIAASRYGDPRIRSATEVRKALENHEYESLKQLLDTRTIPVVIKYYDNFVKSQLDQVVE